MNTDFAYWRKFNNLHGWMERLYREKDGQKESFNCTTVRLTTDDLDRLERDAKAGENLDATSGFFFGAMDEFDVEDQQSILDFVTQARAAIGEGKAVLYDSWW